MAQPQAVGLPVLAAVKLQEVKGFVAALLL